MHGILFRSTDSIEMYDKVNAEMQKRMGEDNPLVAECLVHMCRQTEEGFTVLEVWSSEAKAQEYWDDYLSKAIEATGYDQERIGEQAEHFEPHAFEVHERKTQDA